jgi:hypothetical protein
MAEGKAELDRAVSLDATLQKRLPPAPTPAPKKK